jgi:rhamnosyltransferase
MTETEPSPAPLAIAAVLTAYHPDERLLATVAAALDSCREVIVADNTPEGTVSLAEKLDDPRVRVLRPGRNLGVAAGLNRGIAALSPDIEAVLFLDQDSVLSRELVLGLAEHLSDPTIGAAAPTPWDSTRDSAYDMFPNLRRTVADRTTAITSGMLVRRDLVDRLAGFREDFFVDWVDADFSLRLRRTGARLVQDRALRLPHGLGDRRPHRFLGRTVHVFHYPAWRHYWIARNGKITRHWSWRVSPRWTLATSLDFARWVVLTAMFEPERRTHVPALLKGYRDGLLRRTDRSYLPAGAELVEGDARRSGAGRQS